MDLNKILKIIIFGFVVWIIPTIATFLVSYLNELYIFDIVAAVAIAAPVIVFAYLYFVEINTYFIMEGVTIAVAWLAISIVLDIVLIFIGISQTNLIEYAITVVPLYIIIPAITIGLGLYNDQMAETSIN
ncbi:MAG TPA: hypothetical protein VGC02_02105 [Methanobacterium sp.]